MWVCFKLLRSLFSEDSQPIDFINLNVVGSIVKSIDRINKKQGTQSKQFSVQSVKITSYYLNVTNLSYPSKNDKTYFSDRTGALKSRLEK